MTGKELLEALQQLSESDLAKPVVMEGCDCFGECGEVSVSTGHDIDLLRA